MLALRWRRSRTHWSISCSRHVLIHSELRKWYHVTMSRDTTASVPSVCAKFSRLAVQKNTFFLVEASRWVVNYCCYLGARVSTACDLSSPPPQSPVMLRTECCWYLVVLIVLLCFFYCYCDAGCIQTCFRCIEPLLSLLPFIVSTFPFPSPLRFLTSLFIKCFRKLCFFLFKEKRKKNWISDPSRFLTTRYNFISQQFSLKPLLASFTKMQGRRDKAQDVFLVLTDDMAIKALVCRESW